MAFKGLKRFFTKITKKQATTTLPPISESVTALPDESSEFAANQLLRSSSARYAVVRECDYNDLPPLPHPINHVLPASSAASLASATSTLNSSTRGTYTVTVHGRKRHTSTEFPHANRDLDADADRTQHQLLGLRSDPSVASLLDLYDEHGRLPVRAFSNSPPKEGRAQVVRSGSTLRQLLGNPSSSVNSRSDTSDLGDISWAEQFLGETASVASSSSSPGLPTPDSHSNFPQTPPADNSFMTENNSSVLDNPLISSLEVELSDLVGLEPETPPRQQTRSHNNSPYLAMDPKTPQRASQVFGFLTTSKKRQSQVVAAEEDRADERSLPELPSTFSSPSSAGEEEPSPPLRRNRSRSHFSSDSSADSLEPEPEPEPVPLPVTPLNDVQFDTTAKPANSVHVLMAHGPTKVIVTAPTPSQHHDNMTPMMRGPRGPRAHHHQHRPRYLPTRDAYTSHPARRHVSRSSLGSISVTLADQRPSTSSSSSSRSGSADTRTKAEKDKDKDKNKAKRRGSILAVFDKENTGSSSEHLGAKPELPRTPLRTGTGSIPISAIISRPLPHRGRAHTGSSRSSSPSSSSVDLRQQRRTRTGDRAGYI